MAMEKSGILAGVIKVSKEVSKGKLGIKRICGSCGAKFYDLDKTPIICPKCETPYEEAFAPSKPSAPVAPVKEKPVVEEAALEADEAEDVDIADDDTTVSLEDTIEDDLSDDEDEEDDELSELKEFDAFEEDFEEDEIDEDDSDVALIDDNEE